MRQKTGLANKISSSFLKIKELISFGQFMGMDGPFSDGEAERISDPYRSHSLVNIAVSTLMSNIGRASFRITRDGEFITSGLVFELFRDVNPVMNCFDLWKVTSARWFYSTDKGEVSILPEEGHCLIIHNLPKEKTSLLIIWSNQDRQRDPARLLGFI